MAHFGQSDDFRREELIRIIEHSVEKANRDNPEAETQRFPLGNE